MNETLKTFYGESAPARRPFAGQLEPGFQETLKTAHANVTEADCHFYHTLDLGNGKVIPGGWDLRGNEPNYLGHVDFDGLKVLEFGAASGYLTFWMEAQGADVIGLDLPPGHPPDLVPLSNIDLDANAASGTETATAVRNSWWLGHRELNAKARAVYADIYSLPTDVGPVDVSTFGSILLHLSNPFKALHEAARVTEKALIVTDVLPHIIYGGNADNLVEFNPGDEKENLVNWWRLSPRAISRMFRVLGFPHIDIHTFECDYHPYHKPDAEPAPRFMFTAVGQRERDALPRTAITADEAASDQRVREWVPQINVDNYNDAHRRLQDAHRELEGIYSSLAWKLTKPLRMLTGK